MQLTLFLNLSLKNVIFGRLIDIFRKERRCEINVFKVTAVFLISRDL